MNLTCIVGDSHITFASSSDARKFQLLDVNIAHYREVLETLEHERQEILRRANWSLGEIMDREG